MTMTEQGHYETVGDVEEWVWDTPPVITVPKGEFDPRDPAPPKAEPKAKPKGK
jgi:hypothetical protein